MVNCICDSDRPLTIAVPLVKMRLERSAERDKRKNKNNPSSDYAQSNAEGILNRFVCLKRLSAEKQQTAFSAPPPCNLCNCDKFS